MKTKVKDNKTNNKSINGIKNGMVEAASKNRTEFLDFLNSYNIIGMTVGVVVGNAVKDLVTSIANDLVMPLIGVVTPTGSYQDISIMVKGSQVKVGSFIGSLLDFFIIAFVVFIVVKKIFRIEVKNK